MTTATRRHSTIAVAMLGALACVRLAAALPLDDRGEIKLGMRAYTAVRIGSEHIGDSDNPLNWPQSGAGHVRQHRYFLQLDFDHDLTRISETGWGPARVFGLMNDGLDAVGWKDPLEIRYTVQYRGEGEGIYDYGPKEYSDQGTKLRATRLNFPTLSIPGVANLKRTLPEKYIDDRISRLNDRARQRHRLFLAYIDFDKGPFFLRIGRQVLAWGETDIFRLLDNINPLDDSFGGFFIALDERRLPIEMIRSSYRFGS